MGKLKAIIFDMDGTLADTEDIHRQAFNLAFEEFGIPLNWSRSEYKRLLSISGGKERIRHCLKSRRLVKDEQEAVKITAAIHQGKSDLYRQKLVTGKIELRPGVRRLIMEARQAGVRLAIATSSSGKNVEALLDSALGKNSSELFSAIVTCDIVEEKKPSPAVYYSTLAALGLGPENCIAIEDTTNGNRAALAAGIKTIITTHALTVDNDFPGASLVLDQLGEPDKPFKRVPGNSYKAHYVDLALLQSIHSPPEAAPIEQGLFNYAGVVAK